MERLHRNLVAGVAQLLRDIVDRGIIALSAGGAVAALGGGDVGERLLVGADRLGGHGIAQRGAIGLRQRGTGDGGRDDQTRAERSAE